jgi:beta-lactamase regulating signal transducer with metallopeptidase domain
MQILFSETLIHALGWTLVHSLWQGCLVVCIAACLLHIYRHKSAQLRYILAYGCLLSLFFTTVFTFGLLFKAKNAQNTEGGISIQQDVGETIFYWGAQGENASFTALWVKKATIFFNTHLTEISIAWFIGLLFFGLKLGFGLMRLQQWQKRGGIPLDEDLWQIRLRHFQQQLSISRPITLLASTWSLVPLTIGWLKPLIFIPIGMVNQLSAAEIEAILAHELVHIAERDYVLNVIQAFIEVVFYHHPAVWWLSNVIRTEREMRCDEMAVRLCQNDAISYAKTLVRLQEHFASADAPHLALAFSKKESVLSRRVKNLFSSRIKQSTIMEKITITALLVGALCALSFMKNEVKMPQNARNTYSTSQESREGGISTFSKTGKGIQKPMEILIPLSKTHFTEGGVSKIKDTIPQDETVKITRAKPEIESTVLKNTPSPYAKQVYLAEKKKPDGTIVIDTVIRISINADNTPQPVTESQILAGTKKSEALEAELLKDGLVTDPSDYEVAIKATSLKVDGKFVDNKALIDKYYQYFTPNAGKNHTFKKVGEKTLGKMKKDTLPTYRPEANPPTPPNAKPGHCYAYCKNADGSPKSEWLEIPCNDKVTPAFIAILVKKLKVDGFLEASFSSETITKDIGMAVLAYQKKHNLPEGNLNLPTLKHMGIEMP